MPTSPALPATAPVAPAPFLRWAGGKRRLMPALTAAAPTSFGRFVEPFFGGGALMFELAKRGQVTDATVNDLNPALVCLYRTLAEHTDVLLDRADEIAEDYRTADAPDEVYYSWRDRFNQRVASCDGSCDLDTAALMLVVNRTCFNGLWRVNSSGLFNVPWGRLKNPTLVDRPLLESVADVLRRTDVLCGDYVRAARAAGPGDLVYLDPPYIPHTPTSSFSKYTADDFGRRDQFTLAGLVRGMVADGAHVMLSNADDTDGLVHRIYGDCSAEGNGFYLLRVATTRSISAKASSRGKVHEVLGVSWGPDQATDIDALAGLAQLAGGAGPALADWEAAVGR